MHRLATGLFLSHKVGGWKGPGTVHMAHQHQEHPKPLLVLLEGQAVWPLFLESSPECPGSSWYVCENC